MPLGTQGSRRGHPFPEYLMATFGVGRKGSSLSTLPQSGYTAAGTLPPRAVQALRLQQTVVLWEPLRCSNPSRKRVAQGDKEGGTAFLGCPMNRSACEGGQGNMEWLRGSSSQGGGPMEDE